MLKLLLSSNRPKNSNLDVIQLSTDMCIISLNVLALNILLSRRLMQFEKKVLN